MNNQAVLDLALLHSKKFANYEHAQGNDLFRCVESILKVEKEAQIRSFAVQSKVKELCEDLGDLMFEKRSEAK
jgi:hypothetical protein